MARSYAGVKASVHNITYSFPLNVVSVIMKAKIKK